MQLKEEKLKNCGKADIPGARCSLFFHLKGLGFNAGFKTYYFELCKGKVVLH